MKKKKNVISAIIIFCGFVALLFWLFIKIKDIGAKLDDTSIYLVYAYYITAGLFVIYFIVRPFFIVMFAPSFSLEKIHTFTEEKDKVKMQQNYEEMKKMAYRLISKKLVCPETITKLKTELTNTDPDFTKRYVQLRQVVNSAVDDDLKGDIRKIIIQTARDTMYFTSVSQNGFADTVIVLVNNFRQMKKIIVRCGFRPTFFRMIRIYIHVMISCFIADGAQSIDIGSLLGGSIKGLAKPIIGSLVDGAVNSYLMLRAGFLTKNMIFLEHDSESKEINLFQNSFVEAAAALPELTIASFVEPIINVLKGTFVTPAKEIVKRVFRNDDPYAEEPK